MLAVPQWEFADVISAVMNGRADLGVLPVENSLIGEIGEPVRSLAEMKSRITIVGETSLEIEHCLLALPGTSIGDLQTVASHPAALAQCTRLFETHLYLRPVTSYDTAGAARHVAAHGLRSEAAIASKRAADRYRLQVLLEGVGDSAENRTRFVIIAARPSDSSP
jgi:prephenate dehydratase